MAVGWILVDPLYRLEHEQTDKRRAASRKTVLTQLTELADAHGQDDYSSNARLRQGMRKRKRKEREREEEATVSRPDIGDLDVDEGGVQSPLLEDGSTVYDKSISTLQQWRSIIPRNTPVSAGKSRQGLTTLY